MLIFHHVVFSVHDSRHGAAVVSFRFEGGNPHDVLVHFLDRDSTVTFRNEDGRLKPCMTHCREVLDRIAGRKLTRQAQRRRDEPGPVPKLKVFAGGA